MTNDGTGTVLIGRSVSVGWFGEANVSLESVAFTVKAISFDDGDFFLLGFEGDRVRFDQHAYGGDLVPSIAR